MLVTVVLAMAIFTPLAIAVLAVFAVLTHIFYGE